MVIITEDLGRRLKTLIQTKVPIIPDDVAGTRMIEEAVEMALTMGSDPAQILMAVADALHNEAKKAGVYPSSLNRDYDADESSGERLVELADMNLQIKYLATLSGIPWNEVETESDVKMTSLENLHEDGNLTIYPNGKIYRKKRD